MNRSHQTLFNIQWARAARSRKRPLATLGQYGGMIDDAQDYPGTQDAQSGSSDFKPFDFDYSGQGQTQQQPTNTIRLPETTVTGDPDAARVPYGTQVVLNNRPTKKGIYYMEMPLPGRKSILDVRANESKVKIPWVDGKCYAGSFVDYNVNPQGQIMQKDDVLAMLNKPESQRDSAYEAKIKFLPKFTMLGYDQIVTHLGYFIILVEDIDIPDGLGGGIAKTYLDKNGKVLGELGINGKLWVPNGTLSGVPILTLLGPLLSMATFILFMIGFATIAYGTFEIIKDGINSIRRALGLGKIDPKTGTGGGWVWWFLGLSAATYGGYKLLTAPAKKKRRRRRKPQPKIVYREYR